ncbi:MAG: response regulator [Candidatus Omnitrophica bacterium]|nr:response regulator [Candidatus Omnitrophota bacterium]MDD5672236.1 response regulator [Candidatus Omnitrophota bacterium]
MSKRILVIDDDAEFVDAVAGILRSKDYLVSYAASGKEGIKKVLADGADLIILDVMMTHRTEGFEVARKLKVDPKTAQIPIVMITGIRKEMNLPFGFDVDSQWLPVKAVLEKPVKPQVLLETIEHALR